MAVHGEEHSSYNGRKRREAEVKVLDEDRPRQIDLDDYSYESDTAGIDECPFYDMPINDNVRNGEVQMSEAAAPSSGRHWIADTGASAHICEPDSD